MRWRDLRKSTNVDDVRGRGRSGGRRSGGMPLRVGGMKSGIGMLIVLGIVYFLGGPEMISAFLGGGGLSTGRQADTPAPQGQAANDVAGEFIAAVLGSTEDEWQRLFAASGEQYQAPRLTRFSGSVQSACGYASAASGPFYCPADRRVYIDTAFFNELARMGGAGDFAQAYVIGHEIGHHVQNILGVAGQVRNAQGRVGQVESNRLQVAMELQADCYAGVWAHHANRRNALLEPGDVDEGLSAAAAIGDDTLQRNAGRRVTPESFTHGTSSERQEWLRAGLASGDPASCDTFGGG